MGVQLGAQVALCGCLPSSDDDAVMMSDDFSFLTQDRRVTGWRLAQVFGTQYRSGFPGA